MALCVLDKRIICDMCHMLYLRVKEALPQGHGARDGPARKGTDADAVWVHDDRTALACDLFVHLRDRHHHVVRHRVAMEDEDQRARRRGAGLRLRA